MLQFVRDLSLEGHPNCTTGSRVTAIFLNGWILPIGGASALEGLLSTSFTLQPSSCPLTVIIFVALSNHPDMRQGVGKWSVFMWSSKSWQKYIIHIQFSQITWLLFSAHCSSGVQAIRCSYCDVRSTAHQGQYFLPWAIIQTWNRGMENAAAPRDRASHVQTVHYFRGAREVARLEVNA